MKRLRWQIPERTVPSHPYRDSAIFYAILAGCLVGVSALTGGKLRVAIPVAVGVFIAATAYSWWRWREKLRSGEER
jgi:hypothetical protein